MPLSVYVVIGSPPNSEKEEFDWYDIATSSVMETTSKWAIIGAFAHLEARTELRWVMMTITGYWV